MVNIQQHIPRDEVFTINTLSTNAPTELSAELTNQSRHAFIVINTSTGGQTISLGFGKDAVDGKGVVLKPGAVYHETVDYYFKPTNARITATSDIDGGTLALHERIANEF